MVLALPRSGDVGFEFATHIIHTLNAWNCRPPRAETVSARLFHVCPDVLVTIRRWLDLYRQ
jgi:hypothetical protein